MPHCGGEAGIDTRCILYSIEVIQEELYFYFESTFFSFCLFIKSFAM